MREAIALTLGLAWSLTPSLSSGTIPALHPPSVSASVSELSPSSDGTFTLTWVSDDSSIKEPIYHVQLALDKAGDFEDWYTGPLTESFVSGVPTGTAYVRARVRGSSGWSDWSIPLSVPVRHHSWSKALLLFSLGLIVFLCITLFIAYSSFSLLLLSKVRSTNES